MHHYKHNIGDYRRRTAHLSLMEHGIYRQLLDEYYLNEEPIPDKTQSVYRRLQARTEEEQAAVRRVLLEFFARRDGAWHHEHCEEIIAEYQARADKNRTNGKLGGRPRKDDDENPNGFNKKAKPKATRNQKPKTTSPQPPEGGVTQGFEELWSLMPRKVAKPVALEAYVKALEKAEHGAIIAGLRRHLPGWNAKIKADGSKEHIPHPATWLDQERWNDEVDSPAGEQVAQKEWHETREGIISKAAEINHPPYDETMSFPAWADSVKRKAGFIRAPELGIEDLVGIADKRSSNGA